MFFLCSSFSPLGAIWDWRSDCCLLPDCVPRLAAWGVYVVTMASRCLLQKTSMEKKIIWQKSETQNLGSGTVVTEMAAKGVLSVVSSLVWTKVYSRGKLKCVVNQIASFWFPNHKCILTQGPAFWKAVFRASDQHRKCLKWHKLQQKTCDRTTQGVLKNKTCFFHEFWEKRNLSAATG